MVSEGRNHASTATTNLLYNRIIKTNNQIFKITIVLILLRLRPRGWQMSAVIQNNNCVDTLKASKLADVSSKVYVK